MAPEQVRAEPIDHRADIFALGVVMQEMLSGTRPFQRDTIPETLTAILKDDVPDLSAGVAPAVARVVSRSLEKRRDDRFHSAHDLACRSKCFYRERVPLGAGVTPAARVPRRKALIYGASSLALLASGLAGGIWLGGRGGPAVSPSFRRLTFRRGLIGRRAWRRTARRS